MTPQRHLEMSCEQKILACKRIGQAINMAVDRLVTIGEIISEGFQDIKADMFECCKDSRDTGIYIHIFIYHIHKVMLIPTFISAYTYYNVVYSCRCIY